MDSNGWRARGRPTRWSTHAIEQPGAGEFPIAANSRERYPQRLHNFLISVPAEIAKFYNLRGARFQSFQLGQGLVQQEDIDVLRLHSELNLGEVDLNSIAAAALGLAGAGMVDQNAAHLLAGNGKEVPAILDFERFRADQPDVSLVYERGSLEGVSRTFAAHLAGGNAVELGVYLPDGGFGCVTVAEPHAIQQGCERGRIGLGHSRQYIGGFAGGEIL